MSPKHLIKIAFLNALGTFLYIGCIALLVTNGQQWFGEVKNSFAPVLVLTLFVVSAAVTGSLVLGRPIYLIATGKIRDGIKLLITTVLFLALFAVSIFFTVGHA